jgi:hypothetical protein
MEIHIARDGKQFGPYTISEVNDYLGTGFLKPDDLAWHEGLSDWKPLSNIEGVRAAAPARRAPLPPPAAARASAAVKLQAKPKTYLVSAILTTLFCGCGAWPFGVVAIVYASQVDSKWAAGDHQGAALASEKAKMWSYIAAGVGLLVSVGWGVLFLGALAK